ncbi:hypothetical protein QTN25_010178 [Entamoeba marina]
MTKTPIPFKEQTLFSCQCKKNNCLSENCPCFAKFTHCGPLCNCHNCKNTKKNSVEVQEKALQLLSETEEEDQETEDEEMNKKFRKSTKKSETKKSFAKPHKANSSSKQKGAGRSSEIRKQQLNELRKVIKTKYKNNDFDNLERDLAEGLGRVQPAKGTTFPTSLQGLD